MYSRTNEARAEVAYRAILYYGQHHDEGSSIDDLIIDLATDLLHLCEVGGYADGAEALHRLSWHHYQAELVEQATS